MRRAALLLFVATTATGCSKHDEALDTVGHAQVLDIHGDQPAAAFTYHVERKGARWLPDGKLDRPVGSIAILAADAPDAKVDRSIEGAGIDAFLRSVAADRRGTPATRPAPSAGKVTIRVLGPLGRAPVVLERIDGTKWTVDGAELADPVRLEEGYRGMMRELGLYSAVAATNAPVF